ncbi:hypothetical protein F5J12DRAFT_892410 [Pisolithus orientalis]|uniref:uncharacterized protein n=1 Tax=Pisolithus orientalis TaxID=936130 RepID=UPI0022256893|nr:uncharacterized protein F5J12DRAFT_892410 [Pisolithus orientalis]KAI6007531.1 hypothetical protein F5J12DRAFT_892410 [Pisolithus orientalis]
MSSCAALSRAADNVWFQLAHGKSFSAPGEAEVELACLQSCRLINAVIMPYNNALLFGMTHVVHRFEDMQVYSSEAIEDFAGPEWGDLHLITLMGSIDDDTGCQWCSVDVACQLVHYGFGRTLFQAAIMLQFVEFMEFVTKWHNDVCEVLRTDLSTSLDPNLTSLAAFCSQCLSWSLDTIQSRLIDAFAGAAMHALLWLPGNIDGEELQHGLQVISYFNKPLPTYRLSVLSWPLAMPVDMDQSPLGEDANDDAFYEIEVPTVMLEHLRPDLVQDPIHPSSQLSHVQLVDEDAGHQPFESIVNLVALSPEAGVINLTGGEETQTGIVDLMSED